MTLGTRWVQAQAQEPVQAAYSFYLASRFGHQMELRGCRGQLLELGYGLTPATLQYREQWCVDDLHYVSQCDALIAFTEAPGPTKLSGRGGHHVEMGYALALGKIVFVVGPRENIFRYHPLVRQSDEWQTLLSHLSATRPYVRG